MFGATTVADQQPLALPVMLQKMQALDKRGWPQPLVDIAVGTQIVGQTNIVSVGRRGNHHQRQILAALFLGNQLQCLETVQLGHIQVDQHQIRCGHSRFTTIELQGIDQVVQ